MPELDRGTDSEGPMSTVAASITNHPALEALADGFCTVDRAWRVTYWNAAAERWLGVRRDDALGRALWEVLPGVGEAELRSRLEADGAREPIPFASPSGRALTVEATPVEGGGAALHFRDATEQVRIAERYARLLESLRDGFVAVDADWRVVYLNPAAESLLPARSRRALGASLLSVLPANPPELGETLRGTMRDGAPRYLQAVRPAGRFFGGRCFDLWTQPLAGGGISFLFQDVTTRQERETELARLATEAEEASRAKSRFFAAVSHELRTPLHAIVGYTHLLATDSYGALPAGATRAAERAGVCSEHLARLIDDVLLLTTTEIGRLQVIPSPIALAPYLAETLEPLRHQAEAKGIEFAVDVPAELPALETDPERLRQLLYALVTNAVKFTRRGRVCVCARPVQARERRSLVDGGAMMIVPAVEIAVCDTGPGIPAEARERVFEAFEQLADDSRTDSIHRGTGLGLTVARQLVRLLGGVMELESEPGAGSVFRVRLPLVYGRAVA
jgi:signal transduction histidine kinase